MEGANKKPPPAERIPDDILLDRGAWVPKIVSLLPLIERRRRQERIREKCLARDMSQ